MLGKVIEMKSVSLSLELLKKVAKGDMYESRISLLKAPNVMTMTTLIRLEIDVANPMAKMGSSW